MWKNPIESSEGEDMIRTRSKQRRNNGNNGEEPLLGSSQAFRKNPGNPEEVTDVTSQSEADTRRPVKRVAKKKVQRDKKNPETVLSKSSKSSKLRDVPADVEQLAATPFAEVGASAIEWIEDIEEIRKGSSNLQGGLSGHIRKRTLSLKTTVRLLMEKAAEQGDPAYLRRHNQELSGDLRVAQQEIKRLKNIVKDLQDIMEEGNIREIQSPAKKVTKEKATSPLERVASVQDRLTRAAAEPVRTSRAVSSTRIREEPRVDRTENETREVRNGPSEIDLITEQINTLVARRKELRRMATEEESALPQRPRKVTTQVTVREENPESEGGRIMSSQPSAQPTEQWSKVVGRKQKAKERKRQTSATRGRNQSREEQGRNNNAINTKKRKRIRRRPPRTAVAIKGVAEDFSYSENLRKARNSIQLTDLGIGLPKMRKTANGGVLIEIA